jgi:15-cis-phytoene synthase
MSVDTATAITKNSRSSFYYSFNLLPKEQREAIYTVYAFCKKTDDIVDEHKGSVREKELLLRQWRTEFEKSLNGGSSNPLFNKLSRTARHFKIPAEHFSELIKGVEMDLNKNRYSTFDELYTYCYRVASTVGLMCAEIFSYTKDHTKQYAINLGIALQLTNIIRDVKSDLNRNRIYIPQEDLKQYNYTEHDLRNHIYDDRFVALMSYQTDRARSYYTVANEHLAPEDEKHFFAARIMEKIYFSILRKIEGNNYNVFDHKIRIGRFRQLLIALNIWFSHRVIPVR